MESYVTDTLQWKNFRNEGETTASAHVLLPLSPYPPSLALRPSYLISRLAIFQIHFYYHPFAYISVSVLSTAYAWSEKQISSKPLLTWKLQESFKKVWWSRTQSLILVIHFCDSIMYSFQNCHCAFKSNKSNRHLISPAPPLLMVCIWGGYSDLFSSVIAVVFFFLFFLKK